MNLTESFKVIRKNDADKVADFFTKHNNVANFILQEMNCAETKESVAQMTGGIFDLVSLMQSVRNMESGTYIRMVSKFIRVYGKYNLPALYNLGMIIDITVTQKIILKRDDFHDIPVIISTGNFIDLVIVDP